MRRHELREFAKQIWLGDDYALTLNRAQRKQWEKRSRWTRFHSDESGKISFISIFTTLAFIVMIVLVTNIGKVTSQKIALQNAADSTAYSTAVWPARSLNAITTANHLMGELTAMTVILDSFGGRLLSSGEDSWVSDESKESYTRIEDLAGAHFKVPTVGTWTNSLRFAEEIDREIVDAIAAADSGMMTEDKGKFASGAAIYDARWTLQFRTFQALKLKNIGNVALEVGAVIEKFPPASFAGVGIQVAGIGIHVVMTPFLVGFATEWMYLEFIETALQTLRIDKTVLPALRSGVIPAVSLYADTVAGSPLRERVGRGTGQFSLSVQSTQQRLETAFRLDSALSYPSWQDVKLPLAQEPPPRSRLGVDSESDKSSVVWEIPPSLFHGDYTDGKIKEIDNVYRAIRNAANAARVILWPMKLAADAIEAASNFLRVLDVPEELTDAIDNLNKLKELEALFGGYPSPPSKDEMRQGIGGNPCLVHPNKGLRLPEFDWKGESKSQWVRATYPYVDELRAPIIRWFRDRCEFSNAATYYVHWSNRYTLANSFEIRKSDEVDESDDEDAEERGLIAELRKKIQELRSDFEDASDQTEEENSGNVEFDGFTKVSDGLMEVLSFRDKLPAFAEWFADVADHKDLIQQVKGEAKAPGGAKVSADVIEGLAEEMARVNVLDELLNLLEDFMDSLEFKEPHMYVLKGMQPESKGVGEPWINNDDLAEKLFVITAVVSKEAPKVMGPKVFNVGDHKRYAVASAIVYNANGRDPDGGNKNAQPNTGWDTLNWEPPVKAFEWGDHKPTQHSNASPWNLLQRRALSKNNRVKLNWQVKLVPLTPARLEAITKEFPDAKIEVESHALFTH